MLENGRQLCAAIGLPQGEECDYALGFGLRDKQQIVVFAADPFEIDAPNPLPVPVKAIRECTVSKFHERRSQAPLFEEFKRSCLDSDCS